MDSYIGAKVILAEPMDEATFESQFKHEEEKHPTRSGYHVVYANPGGTQHDSWSPKEVFEEAYRRVSDGEKALISQ